MTQLEKIDNTQISASDFEAPTGIAERAPFKLTSGHLALFLLGLFSISVIAFITIARSVQITAVTPILTTPEKVVSQPAEVKISSWIKLPLGNRVLILPGTHKVEVSAEGFQTLNQELAIGSERHQQIQLTLLRLPGQLNVLLEPNIAASVTIDGEAAGELPGLLESLAAGEHEIVVDAPLYRPASQRVMIEGKGQTQELALTLEPAWAEYTINSQPTNATVIVDDTEVGQTPLTVKLEEGTRSLSVKADKFKPFLQDVTVVAQQDTLIPTVELIPADGILSLESRPAKAAVILNGEYRGITPLTLAVLPDKKQNVKIYKAGFKLAERSVTLEPDERDTEALALQQDLVPVKVSVTPKGAEIFVDGVSRGIGSQTLTLNTLPHRISVRKAGFVEQNNDIIPTRNSKQIISVNLLTVEQSYWAQLPDTYTSGAGHPMKLFKAPGVVRMGSSRREAGRRANEVVYEATLKEHFYVSTLETTNRQFRLFKSSHNSGNYKKKSLDSGKHPVVNVSWQQAALYCNWLSEKDGLDPFYQTKKGFVSGNNSKANGYRLLTEVEWAWLARNKQDEVLIYPWGNDSDRISGSKRVGNFADVNASDLLAFTIQNYNDGFKASSPVGRFNANHRGIFDLGGNVSEWTNDWYSAKGLSVLSETSRLVDPLGPDVGEFHVVRGGSWAKGHLPQLRLAYRDFGAKGKFDVGFRIARYAGPNK